ncbi:peptidoglycan transpeptidase [Desulfuromonas sp. DDH964]|uniref:penicillin-binding protein 2 n=1 Tax=Desulfuromonas sp. DDH964 TaxID=1823759 RepID=UPI00078E4D80|nr:penicillin-binding protein 2 [Desulfuromonas sp. DDH964]AMV72931.1 peptidoglycan transpeptidase [Desulfuromonas sp. DDH964]
MSLDSGWTEHPGLRRRFLVVSLLAMAVFLLLGLRLWYLQVISADRYLALSERNRIRYLPIAAPRGPIYDRDGELLIANRPAFTVSVLRQEVDEKEELLTRLSDYLGVPREALAARWDEGRRFPPYRPFPVAEDVSRDVVERIQENSIDLPGVLIEVRPLRSYPYQEMAAHLFGYLGEITEGELGEERFAEYRAGDFIGRGGLEQTLESDLRGEEGKRLIEVDVKGKELRILKTQESRPGHKVFLTLQRKVQQAAEEAFGDQAGAAVAIDPRNGEILAITSRPSFNPAQFARGISGKEWVALLKNPRHPLQDKALKGQYPPGSTFKMVTALAALRAGLITPGTSFDCTGSLAVGNREFRCWKKEGHGHTDLKKALRESCDVWFYQAALEVGIDSIAETARELGLGQVLGYPPGGEKPGLIPDRQWKRSRYGSRWYDGETVIAAIGQGYVTATPLQLAVMTATIANGGTLYCPHVVKEITDLDGQVLSATEPEVIGVADISPADLRAVQRGMEAVVNDAGGTGWASHLDQVRVAGKTGTAQVVRMKEGREVERQEVAYRFRDHALFVAYAPAENPQIAVAVVVEHGSHGGSAAAPVAKAIFKSYFGIDAPDPVIPVPFSGD